MLFNAKARTKLDAIIHGTAVGETIGLLANQMSEAERAETLTPARILQLSRQSHLTSTSGELLKATIRGLEAADAMGSPSNFDIRTHLHQAYREWADPSQPTTRLRNIRMKQAILGTHLGSFTTVERGGIDGMWRAAPIGLAFFVDAGRAFQIGAEAAALLDADFNSCLGAGVVSLLAALIVQGMSMREAISDALDFIRPLDWPGEISNVLRSLSEEEAVGCYSHPVCTELRSALVSSVAMRPGDDLGAVLSTSKRSPVLVAQFSALLADHRG